MGKKTKKRVLAAAKAVSEPRRGPGWIWPAAIALCVVLFYWVPLTSPQASIHWDAADLHYPLQKTLSDGLRSGRLPFWTPYLFSGYPLLANPEMGAFYLPHWPFFLAGISPRSIQWELVLNAFLACLGAWLLFSRLVGNRAAALLGALAFALSGFFAGHSSHVGLFCAAAGLPWLLLAFQLALESRALRYTALGGLAGGAIILAGYFQTAMYAFTALGLYALAALWRAPRRWARVLAIVGGMFVLALAVAAVQILPGLELTLHSVRAAYEYSRSSEGALRLNALATLFSPDALGALSGPYRGPTDITQYYFYAGLLLVPLALLGAVKSRLRLPALALIVPAVWYMLGPAAGLYRLGGLLPGYGKVRAPIQGWFVVGFALALLAADGAAWLLQRWRLPYLAPALLAILFADLWYWNSWSNPLAYAHTSFDQLYGAAEDAVQREIASSLPPLTRFDAPAYFTTLGPLDSPLNLRLEATYGYFALELAPYAEYRAAMQRNPKLRDGLNVSQFVNVEQRRIDSNPTVLPRAYFPKAVLDVATAEASRRALETLDPAAQSVVQGPHPPIRQDASGTASIVRHSEDGMRVHYHAASPSLLRLSMAWFPGWHASVDGRDCPLLRVDHALTGAVVPAGEHDLELVFRSNYFGLGLAISVVGMLVSAAAVLGGRRRTAVN